MCGCGRRQQRLFVVCDADCGFLVVVVGVLVLSDLWCFGFGLDGVPCPVADAQNTHVYIGNCHGIATAVAFETLRHWSVGNLHCSLRNCTHMLKPFCARDCVLRCAPHVVPRLFHTHYALYDCHARAQIPCIYAHACVWCLRFVPLGKNRWYSAYRRQ